MLQRNRAFEVGQIHFGSSTTLCKHIMLPLLQTFVEKNPHIRIVIDAITLETVSEANELLKTLPVKDVDIICASVAKARAIGGYELMESMNPVYMFSFTGAGDTQEQESAE